MKRILALTITLVIVATVLTGCGKTQNKTSTSNQVIRATIASEPKTLDPSRNNAVDGGNYILCAFEGLTTLGKDGTIVAGTAEDGKQVMTGLFGHSTSARMQSGLTARM